MFNSIKKMLRIIDVNLEITDINLDKYKGIQTIVLFAKLSPSPSVCKNCGSLAVAEDGSITIVKNGQTIDISIFKF